MTTSAAPQLRLMRGAADELKEMELDLELSVKYFDKSAEHGPRLFTPEQLRNYARIMQRARMLFTALRTDR